MNFTKHQIVLFVVIAISLVVEVNNYFAERWSIPNMVVMGACLIYWINMPCNPKKG